MGRREGGGGVGRMVECNSIQQSDSHDQLGDEFTANDSGRWEN